jgi:hypothetical protein
MPLLTRITAAIACSFLPKSADKGYNMKQKHTELHKRGIRP